MPTEDDLRIAFRDMERFTPDTADVLRAVYESPRRPADVPRRSAHSPRPPRCRALRAALALGAAGAVAALAVIVAAAHGPATKAKTTPIAAPASTLRTRLLAAIDTTSGDLLYAHSSQGAGDGTWQWPAYPQPGQGVHLRILGQDSNGTVFKDGEYSFTMPPGNDTSSDLDQGGLQLSGSLMAVNHFRHVWGVWHGQFVLGFPLDAVGIRAEIASGQFTVVGPTELNGQQAIELQINVAANDEAPPHVTAARLWVDATTYLPMQQYLLMSNGQQDVTDYTFLLPTPQNLANLRPVIPPGYTQVSGSSPDLFGQ